VSVFEAGVLEVHTDMYRAWTAQDDALYPGERQPALSNWHEEDLIAFCGGAYAKAAYAAH
jgi:hypothetical protein